MEGSLQIVTREAWYPLEAPPEVCESDSPPAQFILLGHTRVYKERLRDLAVGFWKHDTPSNIDKMQIIYNSDRRKHTDIRYSFVVGTDGKVYEGQGWRGSQGLPRRYKMLCDKSLFIAFMEPLPGNKPTPEMMEARAKLLEYGVRNNHISVKASEFYMNNNLFWGRFKKFLARP